MLPALLDERGVLREPFGLIKRRLRPGPITLCQKIMPSLRGGFCFLHQLKVFSEVVDLVGCGAGSHWRVSGSK